MRLLPWLALAISLTWASSVEARLFWQTYGSTVPSVAGSDCTWNVNQEYFVPRHLSTGRYGLYSPCKSSRSNSPAYKTCYSSHFGDCGGSYCGYTALCNTALCNTTLCNTTLCNTTLCNTALWNGVEASVLNVEPAQFDNLGSIPQLQQSPPSRGE